MKENDIAFGPSPSFVDRCCPQTRPLQAGGLEGSLLTIPGLPPGGRSGIACNLSVKSRVLDPGGVMEYVAQCGMRLQWL